MLAAGDTIFTGLSGVVIAAALIWGFFHWRNKRGEKPKS